MRGRQSARQAIVILVVALLVAAAVLIYMDKSINQHIQYEQQLKTCPYWLKDAPQQGCEGAYESE